MALQQGAAVAEGEVVPDRNHSTALVLSILDKMACVLPPHASARDPRRAAALARGAADGPALRIAQRGRPTAPAPVPVGRDGCDLRLLCARSVGRSHLV